MDLKTYLADTGVKQSHLAKKLGVSRPTMSRLVAGTHRPGLELAGAIERETKGKVKMGEWLKVEVKG